MSGPSPYNALYEIFGHGWSTKDEDHQQHIKIIKKSTKKHSKIHNEREHNYNSKKPLQIDNSCQTQPLRDYSYNKVVAPSKRKVTKKIHEKDENIKVDGNDNAVFSSNIKVHKRRTSSSFGVHLKNSHVSALYKTVSDIERIFREEHNLHLHSRKCLCSSCGALGVITESMKHPVDFGDCSTESDDDDEDFDDDDDDEDEYYVQPQCNNSRKNWKIEYKDSETVRYGVTGTEGYVRLLLELENMAKRVRSLERLAIRNNIPIRRNKVDMAYDMQTHHVNSVPKKPDKSSTSSSEIDKKQCGLFSIPNVIRRRFSKRRQNTKEEIMKAPPNLRSKNYKQKTNDTNKNTFMDIDKKYQSNRLDEKIHNYDLALLNEDEICELMFHLKNKASIKAKRLNQTNIERNNRSLFNQKPETSKPKSNQVHKPDDKASKIKSSPCGLKTITDKPNHNSLRNDKTFIRKSHNYLDNDIETNRRTRNIFNDFLKINNVTPLEKYNETKTSTPRRQKQLHSESKDSEDTSNSYTLNTDSKSQNSTIRELNLEITNREQRFAKNNGKTSDESIYYKSLKSINYSKKDWMNQIINKSIGVIEEKYDQEMKISDKNKISKTVTYSKQNEYHYFKNSLMDIKSNSKSYSNVMEIGESSGLCKQKYQAKPFESSDSDLSREYETKCSIENILPNDPKLSDNFLPVSQVEVNVTSSSNNTLLNEDQNKKPVIIAEVPVTNYNQFEYRPETPQLRSELRTQIKNAIGKSRLNYDEKISEFISNNIFEKRPKKEENIITDIQSLSKTDNGKIPSVENDLKKSYRRSHSEEIKKIENIEKPLVENLNTYKNLDNDLKASETCEVKKSRDENKIFKRKENKGTQVTDINEGNENRKAAHKKTAENNIYNKKDKVEVKVQKPYEDDKKYILKKSSSKRMENKGTQVTNIKDENKNGEIKPIQKVESKKTAENISTDRKYKEEVKALKIGEVDKNLLKKKSSTRKKENKGTQVTEINNENPIKKSFIKETKEAVQKIEHKKTIENEYLHSKASENIRKTPKNEISKLIVDSRRSYRKINEKGKSSEISEINKNSSKRKENKGIQVKEENEEKQNINILKSSKEIKGVQKENHVKKAENKNFNREDSAKRRSDHEIEKSKLIAEIKSLNRKNNESKKSSGTSDVNKNKNSNKKETKGTQIAKINEEEHHIIEEVHECPLSYIFNNYPSFCSKRTNSQEGKKSILKTYRRATSDLPLKLDKRNSVVINKFKKHVNIKIVRKVSSTIIHDIFNRKAGHNVTLTNVFKRQKHIIHDDKKELKHSRIPIPISDQIKNGTTPDIINNPKMLSKIPLYINRANKNANHKDKLNLKTSQNKDANQGHKNVFLHYNAVQNKPPILKRNKKKEINDAHTSAVGKMIYKNCNLPKSASEKRNPSKIPILQITNKNKEQKEVCGNLMISASINNCNLGINGKKATIYPAIIDTNNELLLTFPQKIQLYSAFISVPCSNIEKGEEHNTTLPKDSNKLNSNNIQEENVELQIDSDVKNVVDSDICNSFYSEIENADNSINSEKQKVEYCTNSEIENVEHKLVCNSIDEAKVLPVESDILNSYNSQIEKAEIKIITDSADEAKVFPIDSDILNSYNSQIEKVERKKNIDDEAKLLPVDSEILNSYNSQIDKVEQRKIVSDSIHNDKNSNDPITESFVIQNDVTEKRGFYFTPPCAIEAYASSCTFSEGSSGAVFIYKSKCQMATDMSYVDSDSDTQMSESMYTSTSDLNPSKQKRKWKWLQKFGRKFKSFLSVNTPKSTTVESLLADGNTTCNAYCCIPTSNITLDSAETNECSKTKCLKKKVNEMNIRKSHRVKWYKPKDSSLSFTLTLKKKNTSSSILSN